MTEYALLIILNLPVALYCFLNVVLAYKLKKLAPLQTIVRLIFWGLLIFVIIFAEPIYNFLYRKNLVHSKSLSIISVLLATGIVISFVLIARVYGRLSELESKFTKLHQRLALILSEENNDNKK